MQHTSVTLLAAVILMCGCGPRDEVPNADACEPALGAPANGSVDRVQGGLGDVATYACEPGYVLTGNDGDATRVCREDRTWSGEEPTCILAEDPCDLEPCANGGLCATGGDAFICDCAGTGYTGDLCDEPVTCSVAAPENGSVSATSVTYSSSVTYGCEPGYTLDGTETATCQADGTLSAEPPTCEPNPCTHEPCANGGLCTVDGEGFTCDCEGTGYTGDVCDEPVTCSAAAPDNGSVEPATVVVGEVATYACDETYTLVGDETRVCDASGQLSGDVPKCLGPTAYRTIDLAWLQPQVRDRVATCTSDASCADITGSLNQDFADSIDALDLNQVSVFRPLDPSLSQSAFEVHANAECSAGAGELHVCTAGAAPAVLSTATHEVGTGATCFTADPDTVRSTYPEPNAPSDPCFVTEAFEVELSILGCDVVLVSARMAAKYEDGSPPAGLTDGVLVGFLTEVEADGCILDVPPLCATSLGGLLRSCSNGDDRKMHQDVSGWWLYFDLLSERVDWNE